MRRRAILLLVAMVGTLVVGSGVALAANIINCTTSSCVGTPDADEINGTINPETIKALAGNDYVKPLGGNDTVYGDEGNDVVDGSPGNDTIYGGPDDDGTSKGGVIQNINLEGGADSDTVYGGGGDDLIDAYANDTPSAIDHSYGGRGNDYIEARDDNVDIINCGKGNNDVAFIDAGIDTNVRGCENIVQWT